MIEIDMGLQCLDLGFQGRPGVIASYVLRDGDDVALVEVGPESTLQNLLDGLDQLGIDPALVNKVIVTHIHLDHAGAAGSFLRRFPRSSLYVHQIGAPHLAHPEKLIRSATRIYGTMMEPLWGRIEPVPAERMVPLSDGDEIVVGDTRLRVVYTPGHAAHHVALHDKGRDLAFTGDIAAVRLQGMTYVRPPTPPPELDIEAWEGSIERLLGLNLRTLCLTHFGPFDDVTRHLEDARHRLLDWAKVVHAAVRAGQNQPEMVDALRSHGDREILAESADVGALESYELATPYGMSVDGYLRYFQKREIAETL